MTKIMINIWNKFYEAYRKLPQWVLPTLILLLSALLRLLYLGSMPGGMHQDEAFVAWNGFAIFHEHMDSAGHVMPVYMADWGDGHSALYVWLLQPLLLLSGGRINPFLSRLPQAIIAILTVLIVYKIGCLVLNRGFGLLAMFLLAICPWHVMMSRWGLDANLAPGFLMFGLYFFLRGLDNEKYLLLSACLYGIGLYSYAVIWPIVPFMLLLQIGYGLFHKKLHINRYSILSAVILFLFALPLLLFILVNSGYIAEIRLPFMTIPRMGGYRASEVAFSLQVMYENLRQILALLYYQNLGAPYDILLPSGMFYDIGRIFIAIGVCFLVVHSIRDLIKKHYSKVFFLFVQLLGGGLVCLLVWAVLHQTNALYIPLVLCEAYGLYCTWNILHGKFPVIANGAISLAICFYLICLGVFQYTYYTDYRNVAEAYFAVGMKECVDFAKEQCVAKDLHTITVEKGAQWPRLLLYTETLPSQYISSVEFDVPPAPAGFESDGIRFNTRINYDALSQDSVYIIYYTDEETFRQDYELTKFYDWFVATPRT